MFIPALLRRTTKPVVLVGAAMLLLSGCLRYEFDADISDAGTVDLDVVVAVQKSAAGGLLDETLESGCGGISDGAAFTARQQPYKDGDWTGFRCIAEDITIAQFEDYLNGTDGTNDWTITQKDGRTVLDARIRPGDPDATAEGGEALLSAVTLTFRFTAPGDLGENNATSVDGSTATWELTGADLAGDYDLTATWDANAGSNLLVVGLLVVAGLLVVVGLVLLLTRGRNRGGSGPGAPPAFGTPGGFPPAGGPAAPPWAPAPQAAPQAAPPAWSAPAAPPPPPVAPPPPPPPVAPPPPPPPVAPPPPPPPPVAPPPPAAPPAGGPGTVFAPEPPSPPQQ